MSHKRDKVIQGLLTEHPLHSKTEYLSFARVHHSTQTDETELPNLTQLMDTLNDLRQDFERTKLALKAQYEHQIDERVNTMWADLHRRTSALEEHYRASQQTMRQSYGIRYTNAIHKLGAEFHRQRDALLIHAKRLNSSERAALLSEIQQLHQTLQERESELKRMRMVMGKQAILLRKYGVTPEEKATIQDVDKQWNAFQEIIKAKTEEIRLLQERLTHHEEWGKPATRARLRTTGNSSSLFSRETIGDDAVVVTSAAFEFGSQMPVVKADPLFRDADVLLEQASARSKLNPSWTKQKRSSGPELVNPIASELHLNQDEEEGQRHATITDDELKQVTASVTAAFEEQAKKDKSEAEELLAKTIQELEQSYAQKMEEMEEEHEGELVKTRLELTRLSRQYQKQLLAARESAQSVSSPAGLETILQRQQNVLQFAKLFFAKAPVQSQLPPLTSTSVTSLQNKESMANIKLSQGTISNLSNGRTSA